LIASKAISLLKFSIVSKKSEDKGVIVSDNPLSGANPY
jgi:hypothetical protein